MCFILFTDTVFQFIFPNKCQVLFFFLHQDLQKHDEATLKYISMLLEVSLLVTPLLLCSFVRMTYGWQNSGHERKNVLVPRHNVGTRDDLNLETNQVNSHIQNQTKAWKMAAKCLFDAHGLAEVKGYELSYPAWYEQSWICLDMTWSYLQMELVSWFCDDESGVIHTWRHLETCSV